MGYAFYWHPGQNPSLVTPEGNVVPLLVKRDIPYMAVGSSRSFPKSPKAFVEVPVAPAVEQDESTKNTTDQQVSENKTASSHSNLDVSEATSAENLRERNPYAYTGPLSGECKIPLAALKQAYETFGSECDDEEWEAQDVAMVVRPAPSDLGSGRGFFAATASELDPEASSGCASDEDQAITEPAIKRSRGFA
jgi:hypothetical protein